MTRQTRLWFSPFHFLSPWAKKKENPYRLNANVHYYPHSRIITLNLGNLSKSATITNIYGVHLFDIRDMSILS